MIDRKLADSKARSISLDSRFDLAWEAALQLGLAALRANGYRATSHAGHQSLAIQTLDQSLGTPKETIRLLETFRKNRSAGLYEGSFEPSATEVEALVRTPSSLRDAFLAWLESVHPELLPPRAPL
jgi:hypothetical protein